MTGLVNTASESTGTDGSLILITIRSATKFFLLADFARERGGKPSQSQLVSPTVTERALNAAASQKKEIMLRATSTYLELSHAAEEKFQSQLRSDTSAVPGTRPGKNAKESVMRKGIILTAVIGLFLFDSSLIHAAGKGRKPEGPQSCEVLRGATSGLYGLCVSYCSVRDQSKVDLNEIASVKAAAPSIELLRKYNAKRKADDPEMPCFKNTGPVDGGSGGSNGDGDGTGGNDGSTGGGSPPAPPAQCPCWTGEELASLDGNLPTSSLGSPVVDCTAIEENGFAYKRQVVEGYDIGFLATVEGVAWASTASGGLEPYDGCFFSNSAGSLNLPVERADAESCVQEIANHCALLGSP